jgi:methylenetetrahydrofolate reductase (NADPH)
MRRNIPGVHIPDEIVERVRKAPKPARRAERKRICVEIIQQLREIEGVHGIHLMAYRQEELVAEIVEEAGLLRRPPQAGVCQSEAARGRRRPRTRARDD